MATTADVAAIARVWAPAWFDGHGEHVPDALLAAHNTRHFAGTAARMAPTTLVAVEEHVAATGHRCYVKELSR